MADQNIYQLTENTAPDLDTMLYTLEDPYGTPLDRKVQLQNIGANRPIFEASGSGSAWFAVSGTYYQLGCSTENIDTTGSYASGTFTAPIDGQYFLYGQTFIYNWQYDANYYTFRITTSNRSHFVIFSANRFTGNMSYWEMNIECIMDMDENDTAILTAMQNGGTMSQAQAYTSDSYTHFGGILIG